MAPDQSLTIRWRVGCNYFSCEYWIEDKLDIAVTLSGSIPLFRRPVLTECVELIIHVHTY